MTWQHQISDYLRCAEQHAESDDTSKSTKLYTFLRSHAIAVQKSKVNNLFQLLIIIFFWNLSLGVMNCKVYRVINQKTPCSSSGFGSFESGIPSQSNKAVSKRPGRCYHSGRLELGGGCWLKVVLAARSGRLRLADIWKYVQIARNFGFEDTRVFLSHALRSNEQLSNFCLQRLRNESWDWKRSLPERLREFYEILRLGVLNQIRI